ncbi:MAG: DEAD/DEAH box helicase [bacterium]|jgi:superfamily II DNA/RNA helicase|nr:DEAD/DEAH box helicase [bacterium]
MNQALTIHNLPSSVPDFVLKQIFQENHIRYENIHLGTDPDESGLVVVHVVLEEKAKIDQALATLNECEVGDQVLQAEVADSAVVRDLIRVKEEKRRKKLRSQGVFLEEDKITPDKLDDPASLETPFSAMNLSDTVMRNLARQGIEKPTPIQALAIPYAMQGCDIIGRAQTGTGKTIAFAIPIIERILANPKYGVRALILAPTRELAIQTQQVFETLVAGTNIKTFVMYGGEHILDQLVKLREGVDILVATPGRLLDLQSRSRVRFDMAEVFVLDEADRMMDMGFIPDIQTIYRCFYEHPQTLMFTATTPKEFVRETKNFLHEPVFIDVGAPDLSPLDTVEQEIIHLRSNERDQKLYEILKAETGPTIIFSSTKKDAERLASYLAADGFQVSRIHGDIEQSERIRAVELFKSGVLNILVATDVAARGLDIDGVAHVINYDLPSEPEDHLHRIGRTARAGASGKATTFVTPEDERHLKYFQTVFGR